MDVLGADEIGSKLCSSHSSLLSLVIVVHPFRWYNRVFLLLVINSLATTSPSQNYNHPTDIGVVGLVSSSAIAVICVSCCNLPSGVDRFRISF